MSLLAREFIAHSKPVTLERLHTQYDAELGWSNIPNLVLPDMYGPGIYFKTNAQGFRNEEDITPQIPDGKIRLICSGDSFTLGVGVSNKETWCEQIKDWDRYASKSDRFQTVNMGQGGYGLDQIYLWFKRDGAKLDHQVHVLALFANDLIRMQHDKMFGYGKPVIRVTDGALVVENVPVPRQSYLWPKLTENVKLLNELKSVQLIRTLMGKRQLVRQTDEVLNSGQALEAAFKILESFKELNQQKGSMFLVVYLPGKGEYQQTGSERLRALLERELAARRIDFLDLSESFNGLQPTLHDTLFIKASETYHPDARAHYSAQGNEYVASSIYRHLLKMMKARIDAIGLTRQ